MTDFPNILVDTIDSEQLGSLFLVLFWGFLIAAIVWFLIWLFLGALEEEGGSATSDSVASGKSGGNAAAVSSSAASASNDGKSQAAADVKAAKDAATATAANVKKDDFSKLGLAGGTAQVLNAEGTM